MIEDSRTSTHQLPNTHGGFKRNGLIGRRHLHQQSLCEQALADKRTAAAAAAAAGAPAALSTRHDRQVLLQMQSPEAASRSQTHALVHRTDCD
jgi:hypothetical protein